MWFHSLPWTRIVMALSRMPTEKMWCTMTTNMYLQDCHRCPLCYRGMQGKSRTPQMAETRGPPWRFDSRTLLPSPLVVHSTGICWEPEPDKAWTLWNFCQACYLISRITEQNTARVIKPSVIGAHERTGVQSLFFALLKEVVQRTWCVVSVESTRLAKGRENGWPYF